MGQVVGPFVLPCHAQKGYQGNATGLEAESCAGAAIFRANIGIAERMPDLIFALPALSDPNVFESLPALSDPNVFESLPAFIRHHIPDATDNKIAAMIAMIPEFLSDELRIAAAKGRCYPIKR